MSTTSSNTTTLALAPSSKESLPYRSRVEMSRNAQAEDRNSPRYLVLLDAINLGLPVDDKVRAIAESVEKYEGPSCLDKLLRTDATTFDGSSTNSSIDLDEFLNPGEREVVVSSAATDLLELIDPDNRLPISTFHPFMRLPKELRSDIWNIYIESTKPRYIHVTLSRPDTANEDRSASSFKTKSSVPAILHICRESRKVGLIRYTTIFNTINQSGVGRRQIFARPAADTIIIHLPKWMKQCHTAASLFNIRLEYPAGLSSLDFASISSPWSNETHTMSKLSTFAWVDANRVHPCYDLTRDFLVVHLRSKDDWTTETIGVDTGIQCVRDVQLPACWDGFWTAFCHGLEVISPGARCAARCTGCVKNSWVLDYDGRFWNGLNSSSPRVVGTSYGVRRK
ncbi:hypothetical protein BKA64DRAFT_722023 [Cadophora sp. MPI-SDFR-AT-0126]|nr:hypothetical protein BKA64DRAFT_722023 [Leotiomycetes sp. MPI-SDFR-AT-0126]